MGWRPVPGWRDLLDDDGARDALLDYLDRLCDAPTKDLPVQTFYLLECLSGRDIDAVNKLLDRAIDQGLDPVTVGSIALKLGDAR